MKAETGRAPRRDRLHEIIFGHSTPAGKAFDVGLIVAIMASVLAVILDSVSSIHSAHGGLLYSIEWIFTALFTVEYVLRLACAKHAGRYAKSIFGIVDMLAIMPTYLSLLFPGSQALLVIRIVRVLRVFRILKLVQYIGEAELLVAAMKASRRKIAVFILTVLALCVVFGSLVYMVEGDANGFTSILRSIYWAIVTLTTVGYGDISPQTSLGQTVAAIIMMLGYAIIAVPTGIVTVELGLAQSRMSGRRSCPQCRRVGHDQDALHCKFCGASLDSD
jgi:voltage-gated potassium channel